MTPRDEVIGGLVTQDLQNFMSKFVPVTYEATVDVESGDTEASEEGVRILVSASSETEYQNALDKFKASLSEKPQDDKTLFAAGVCCERLGQADEALRYYKQARSLEEEELKYVEAVERVEGRMG
jgi:Flp pilus assembly protein TadD